MCVYVSSVYINKQENSIFPCTRARTRTESVVFGVIGRCVKEFFILFTLSVRWRATVMSTGKVCSDNDQDSFYKTINDLL